MGKTVYHRRFRFMMPLMKVSVHPATSQRWRDLEKLFGPRGACAGCWCMYWRLTRKAFDQQKGEGNRRQLNRLVEQGPPPGLLLYSDEEVVGWCSLGPRENFGTLNRSRVLAGVDDLPVWSVVCFFIDKKYRRQGLTVQLLHAAAAYARSQGASILEGYPVEPKKPDAPPVFVFTGLAEAFRKAGFIEVARRSETRPIMRMML